jgi:hypothetical protein
MTVDFKLRPPLPENVFDNNVKKTEALIASLCDDINHAVVPLAHSFSDTMKSLRDGEGQLVNDADVPQGVFNNMQGTAMAYLAHRMGEALAVDVHQGGDTHNIDVDRQKKEGYVQSWLDNLENHYGADTAQRMANEIAAVVDNTLYEYFPKMKFAEPSFEESKPRPSYRQSVIQRQMGRDKKKDPDYWEMN